MAIISLEQVFSRMAIEFLKLKSGRLAILYREGVYMEEECRKHPAIDLCV